MSIIYEILKAQPQKIKVFNMNFYYSKDIYRQGYSPFASKSYEMSLTTILLQANHDCFSNINFTKNLFDRGLIEVDDDCASVINMAPEEYARGMQEIVKYLKRKTQDIQCA